MIKSFFEIKLHDERVEALVSLLLSGVEMMELQMAFQYMIRFNQVAIVVACTTEIRNHIIPASLCENFDCVLEDYPELKRPFPLLMHKLCMMNFLI